MFTSSGIDFFAPHCSEHAKDFPTYPHVSNALMLFETSFFMVRITAACIATGKIIMSTNCSLLLLVNQLFVIFTVEDILPLQNASTISLCVYCCL